MITDTMPAGQLAALDQAIAAYRDACHAFAYRTAPDAGDQMRAAEAQLRQAGHDPATGLITLPVAAVHFTDVRADGARMTAVNGSLLGGETWICWKGRCFQHGVQCDTYDAYDLIRVKAR